MKSLVIKILAIILLGPLAHSQTTITGTVTDANGQPLPAATVLIENTSKGVATDFDGKFSIEASKGDVLVISFVGFNTSKITVGDPTDYTVILQENLSQYFYKIFTDN